MLRGTQSGGGCWARAAALSTARGPIAAMIEGIGSSAYDRGGSGERHRRESPSFAAFSGYAANPPETVMTFLFSCPTAVRSLAAIGLMFLLAACATSDDSSVRAELRDESSKNGLALVRAGQSIVVIPFDGPAAYFANDYGVEIAGFSKAGSLISRAGDPLRGQSDFVISTMRGKTVVEAPGSGHEYGLVALSEAAGRLTYLKPGSPDGERRGLYWTSFDFSQGGFIDAADGDNPQGDWSPDGRFVTYQKNGSVFLFDVVSGSSRRLAEGHDPTWSQSGDRISFRAPDGQAALITSQGKRVDWPVGTYHALSPIRWSPDGKYVVFSVERPLAIPLITAYYDLLVCRVSDGKAVSVRGLGAGSPDLLGFYWIVDYRHFCSGCKRGEPFG